MKSLLAAAIMLGLTMPANAADLGYGDPSLPYDSASQGYEDDYPVPTADVDDNYVEPGQDVAESYGEDNGYAPVYRRHKLRHAGDCLTRHALRANLFNQGWRDFRGIEPDPDVVGLTATRPNGLVYRLKIDRCSGVIIAAFLLDQGGNGNAYAYESQDVPGY
jgi:hypothetical protein